MNKKYDCISREQAYSEMKNIYFYGSPSFRTVKTEFMSKITTVSPIPKFYVVTKNGWYDSFTHGELVYLLGVFTDENMAKEVAKEHDAEITEIEPNKVFPLTGIEHELRSENDYLLGGYVKE